MVFFLKKNELVSLFGGLLLLNTGCLSKEIDSKELDVRGNFVLLKVLEVKAYVPIMYLLELKLNIKK